MENPLKRGPLADECIQDSEPTDYSANAIATLNVPADCGGQRVDLVLARLLPQHSRSRLQTWIREGRVALAGCPIVEPRRKLWGGETITVGTTADEPSASSAAEDIPLRIVFEDDFLLVLDKPAGLVVHPGNGNWSGTLLNALLHHLPQLAAVARGGIVHRLDKDTSGLMVVAKTPEVQTALVRQLQARTVSRCYQAVVHGIVDQPGIVDAPIGRHPIVRTRMAVVTSGKPARTHYRVLTRFAACTLIECALETGRTHQIRVHMNALGYPLVGDPLYGSGGGRPPRGPAFPRQALHACRLALSHPVTGAAMSWRSEMPADMLALVERLLREARSVAAAGGGAIDGPLTQIC